MQGAGSGRIIAYDNGTEVLTVATGTLTINIAGYDPGFSASSISTGETLLVFENGARSNYMQGTVTSLSGTVLTMNITSTGGSGSTHRWLIATMPSTVFINNVAVTAMFAVTEDSTVNTRLSGFQIAEGTGYADGVDFNAGGGAPIVLQNCWIQQGEALNPATASKGDSVHMHVNRGVVSSCSFDASPFEGTGHAIHMQPGDETAWATTGYWGALDTNGSHNFYAETNDYHAYLNATDNDDGTRSVFRYSVFDNAAFGTHGADTGPLGQRYFEFYNNTGVFNGYSDGSTFPMNWWFFVRGGSFVIFDNTLPPVNSQDYPNKLDVNMTVMNLQRNAGPNPCWGQGTSNGADHFAPRQVGLGYVTGKGVAGNGQSTYSAASYGNSATEYVGDPEPAYIWGNSRSPLSAGISDYGAGNPNSCATPPATDTSANYIILNRDYFNGSTAKPGYAPYTYPHPLTVSGSSGSVPASPTNLSASVQ